MACQTPGAWLRSDVVHRPERFIPAHRGGREIDACAVGTIAAIKKPYLGGLFRDVLPRRWYGISIAVDHQHVALGVVSRGEIEAVPLVHIPPEDIRPDAG